MQSVENCWNFPLTPFFWQKKLLNHLFREVFFDESKFLVFLHCVMMTVMTKKTKLKSFFFCESQLCLVFSLCLSYFSRILVLLTWEMILKFNFQYDRIVSEIGTWFHGIFAKNLWEQSKITKYSLCRSLENRCMNFDFDKRGHNAVSTVYCSSRWRLIMWSMVCRTVYLVKYNRNSFTLVTVFNLSGNR